MTDIETARTELREYTASIEASLDWLEGVAPSVKMFRNPYALLVKAVETVATSRLDGLYCEFGVCSGQTANFLAALPTVQVLHGFDSFNGLPEDWRPGFPKGSFASRELPTLRPNIKLHVGLFIDTLPLFIESTNPTSVGFLHIDSDLYSSANTILCCFEPWIGSGTIIVFDEFMAYPGWEKGEYRALMEFCKRTGHTVEFLGFCGEQVAVRILEF